MVNLEKRNEINQRIYKKGYMSLLDFLGEQKSKDEAKLNYEKTKNKLNGFKYNVKIGETEY